MREATLRLRPTRLAYRRADRGARGHLRLGDRIERAAEQIRTAASFASESYTLRAHIDLVRRTVLAKAGVPAAAGAVTNG